MYLHSDTFTWFKPIVRNQLNNVKTEWNDLTNEIVTDLNMFKKEIHIMFEKINEKWIMKWEIFHLY